MDVSYTRLAEGQIACTVEAAEDVMVDIDADRTILGIEVIGGVDWQRALLALAMAGRLRVAPKP